jgi:S-adenosylmethionine-diacylglycerol 3-amino-3-carboxypropyl transferase
MYKIHYAQCWEDPRTLRNALKIIPQDNVLSIASGGDNSFALLLQNPKSLTALDKNPAQIYLVELKMQAIKLFDYDDFIFFIGARPSRKRRQLYLQLRPYLSNQAQKYWDVKEDTISKGVIHCGKFEHYFALFRRLVLPLIHRPTTINRLLSFHSKQLQRTFYNNVWNNHRWQWLFRIFFGKFILGHLGRDPSFFRYVQVDHITEELFMRTQNGLTKIPIRDNFFLEYIFKGRFNNLEHAHPYLKKDNFESLKKHLGKMRLIISDLMDYLKNLPSGSISKFNLSDIFEYLSDDSYEKLLTEIVRVSSKGAKITFWTLFLPRYIPQILSDVLESKDQLSKKLFAADRTFFYGNFNVWNAYQ